MNRLHVTVLSACCALLSGLQFNTANAAQLSLPNTPLIISVQATPNVFIEMDDSGSMDWEILARTHWTMCAYDGWMNNNPIEGSASKCSTGREATPRDGMMLGWGKPSGNNNDGVVPEMGHVFDFNNNSSCSDYNGYEVVESCEKDYSRPGVAAQLDMDWRARSSSLNVLYYNPFAVYEPWKGGSTSYSNASWSGARSWPDASYSTGYNRVYDLGSGDGFHYNVWIDDKGYNGTRPNRNDMNNTGNDEVDLWDSYIRVTVTDNAISCDRFSITAANSSGMTANKLTLGSCPTSVTNGLTVAEMKQNIANWFQYHRRRVQSANASLGSVLTDLNDFRYGLGYINGSPIKIEMQGAADLDYDAQITTILNDAYDSKRASGGTPLRRGLKSVGEYYKTTGADAPITLSCQKSFAVLFTDGYWNQSDPSNVGDADGDNAQMRRNSSNITSTTLADVAHKYYDEDLRTDLDNAVPTDSFDTEPHQHMVTFTINFGANGLLEDTDGNGWPGSGKITQADMFDWYSNADINQTSNAYWNPRKADDMWHAAWNGKGTFVSAKNPQELVQSFKDALLNIQGRISGAAAAAANSGSISSSSRIFQAKFDSTDWHGELLAIPVLSNGTLDSTPLWNAATKLTAKSNGFLSTNAGGRDVYTYDKDRITPTGVPFEYGSLSVNQKLAMNKNGSGQLDLNGDIRVRYLRGDDTNEEVNSGIFRTRAIKLGDIVDSDPVFVGRPPFFYPFGQYQTFFTSNANRTGMIYVGANDGMMHAIRESDGEEIFAYVPDKVLSKMPKLSDPGYAHDFYVNASAAYGDVQIGSTASDWTSLLAGALGQGGQGLFALDITNPNAFTANKVLWEFTDEIDADLGFTIGQPQVKKMANGKWAVIIGNGVNNTAADGHASTTGTGAVYVLFIKDGIDGWSATDYVKLTVPGGSATNPNAIFTPAAADIDGDNDVDFIYAGDLFGRMWKFDVTSTNPSNWGRAFGTNPLFDAGTDHPITDSPAIAAHPYGRTLGQLVLFGTGKFLEVSDKATTGAATQSIFAVWDLDEDFAAAKSITGAGLYHSKSDLTQNTLTVDSGVRVLGSGTAASWLDGDGAPDDMGWYVDFPTEGERMVRKPILREDLVFFVSMIPNQDPCAAGGTGWIQVLDTLTGQPPTFPVFDIDGDLDITDDDDLVEHGDPDDPSDNLVPGGMFSPSIPNLPAMIYDDRPGFNGSYTPFPMPPNAARGCDAGSARAYSFTTGSNGSIMAIETATESLSCGRQSWSDDR